VRDATGGALTVQLNNLSSFTSDREVAWEFGSSVWEVNVPLEKIVFSAACCPRTCSRRIRSWSRRRIPGAEAEVLNRS